MGTIVLKNIIDARQIVLVSRPKGQPSTENFRLESAALPEVEPGQVLVATRYLSLDPYMRGRMSDRKSYAEPVGIGEVMGGEVVGEVVSSKDPAFAQGAIVRGPLGWRTHGVVAGSVLTPVDLALGPMTTALGVLGMPGFTAYGGLLEIGKPVAGETVVVAAASGPVGSLVGQIGKIKGARAVGIAAGTEKCAYVKDELHFDVALDRHSATFVEELTAACPDGIDVYFENVGGAIWQAVLPLLNNHARVPVCGLIADYNATGIFDGPNELPATMRTILSRSLTVRGFLNYEFNELRPTFERVVSEWIKAGSVRYREDIVKGFASAPEAFIGMLDGHNFGKLLIEV
jgi:NADPH-dependent curcumin reductase CurA